MLPAATTTGAMNASAKDGSKVGCSIDLRVFSWVMLMGAVPLASTLSSLAGLRRIGAG
jgi:hypothetical protein